MTIDLHSKSLDIATVIGTPSVIAIVNFANLDQWMERCLTVLSIVFLLLGIALRVRALIAKRREEDGEG